ncbi:MAG: ATP cone domain-containing protein [Candidatus Aenigmatarchaeota archaeon]
MWIVKASGETEKFDIRKIKRTCLKSGTSRNLANKIANEVKKKTYSGMSTRQILQMTLKLLGKQKPFIAARYDLKGSLFRLGPAGFAFERFIAEILKDNGFKTKLDTMNKGFCVDHEIDIIATLKNRNYMIECKYHNLPGIYTGLREALYTYARFLDLKSGSKKGLCKDFDQPWLICNTRFSEDAVKYSKCAGLNLVGWDYPKKKGLKDLMEKNKLYPITMIRNLDKFSQEKLSIAGLVLIKDLTELSIKELHKITKIPVKKLKTLVNEAERITYG